MIDLQQQIKNFEKGFSFLEILDSASILNHGIKTISKEKKVELTDLYDNFEGSITKFVPSSGAASRMFSALIEYMNSKDDFMSIYADVFFENIEKFAFYSDIKSICDRSKKEVLQFLLTEKGLNFSDIPKGLVPFHRYSDGDIRTALEEHFVEAILYSKEKSGFVKIHFTISENHNKKFAKEIELLKNKYTQNNDLKLEITTSNQDPDTDMIAVYLNGEVVRLSDGAVMKRPGGHGALIKNLNKIDSDIIFIKNIDNISVDNYKNITVKNKKILAGMLLKIRDKIFKNISLLNENKDCDVDEIMLFIEKYLSIKPIKKLSSRKSKIDFCKTMLNRPIRVCGMVKNQGKSGGGPFFVKSNGVVSLQILEQSQIDIVKNKNIFYKSTHFNPVDIVCYTKDYNGKKFDLIKYIDTNTGFISDKKYKGKSIKIQELPGLWNGAMADWNTVFVEVPIETFTPVKSVNDLLDKAHIN